MVTFESKKVFKSAVGACLLFAPLLSQAALPLPPICTMEYAPVCGQVYENGQIIQREFSNICMLQGSNAQLIRYGTCAQQQPYTQPLAIRSFSGPTQLMVNTTGTWSVGVTNGTGSISYQINWGDERYYGNADAHHMRAAQYLTSRSTFTHSYSSPGTYTISITAYDGNGRTATSTTTVYVYQQTYYEQPQPPYYYPTPYYPHDTYYDDIDDSDYWWNTYWNKHYYKQNRNRPQYNSYEYDFEYDGWHPTESWVWQ
jgi:hypothetical protein